MCYLSNDGCSLIQGPHQEAQKSTNTKEPLKEESATRLPFKSGRSISGAMSPTSVPTTCALEPVIMQNRNMETSKVFFIAD